MKSLKEFIESNTNEELKVLNEAIDDEERNYVVYQVGGYVGHIGNAYVGRNLVNVVAKELTKAEATEKRKRMNSLLTPWEKNHVGISYKLTDESKVKYIEKK